MAVALRGSISASHKIWGGILCDDATLYQGPRYDMMHIVGRVGGGDSFAAGLIRSLLEGHSGQDALSFAVAASCLKRSILGDINMATVEEVQSLLEKGGSGRVQR